MIQNNIDHTIVVLSGKGGVGKSTVAVNLAVHLSSMGYSVGLLDTDIHGPSVPAMLSLEHMQIHRDEEGMYPLTYGTMKVMSIGSLMPSNDDALIWRGPLKMQAIKQMIEEVHWDNLDYLIVDSPPGTGDEPLSVCQLIPNITGAVLVTTPQRISSIDVRRSITFCRRLKLPVLGLIENMGTVTCPSCGELIELFPKGGAQKMARDMHIELLGSIPFLPEIASSGDTGAPIVEQHDTMASEIIQKIITHIQERIS